MRLSIKKEPIFIPNRAFLIRFDDMSVEFCRATVREPKIPMTRPNETDLPLKRTKKIR